MIKRWRKHICNCHFHIQPSFHLHRVERLYSSTDLKRFSITKCFCCTEWTCTTNKVLLVFLLGTDVRIRKSPLIAFAEPEYACLGGAILQTQQILLPAPPRLKPLLQGARCAYNSFHLEMQRQVREQSSGASSRLVTH